MIESRKPSRQRRALLALLAITLVAGSAAAEVTDPQLVIVKGAGGGTFDGDTYSIVHQLGAIIDNVLQCFQPHLAGMDDNTVVFDGLSELLDSYLDGTQPFVFEFETTGTEGLPETTINSIANGDLFPEGFEDPATGTPLDAACVEIGIDDTLDSDEPIEVTSALLDFIGDGFDPFDVTSGFTNPWNGRFSVGIPGFTGLGIDEVKLTITTAPSANAGIFVDGFETGDTSAWTDEVP